MKFIFILIGASLLVSDLHAKAAKSSGKHGPELDWWENGVFYQLYPLSFKDSGTDGRGDLKGITAKLSHLSDLGVTGLWLNPIFKSKMIDFGYDVSDFRTIHDWFGNQEDFDALLVEVKRLGLKLILDIVPNHSSDDHEWFQKSVMNDPKYADYYVWRNGIDNGTPIPDPPNNWLAVFHTKAWTYNATRGQYYLHQFTAEQPDLNYRNADVRNEMRDILRFWLDKGIDGFRIDAINHMFEDPQFRDEALVSPGADPTDYENLVHTYTKNLPESYELIYDWRDMFDEYKSRDGQTRLMMTEAYAPLEETMLWYGNNGRKGGHIPFNFALIMNLDDKSTAVHFKNEIDLWINNMPAGGIANWVLGNHDRKRIGSRYGEDRVESLAILSLTLPGIAVVYYGEEIGMVDNPEISWEDTQDPQGCNTNSSVFEQYSRDPVRTPFQWDASFGAGFSTGSPWLPVNKNYPTLNLANQKTAEKSVFKLYQQLIKMKKEEHSFIWGEFQSRAVNTNVLAYTRIAAEHDYFMVAVNMGANTETVDFSMFDSSLTGSDEFPEEGHVMIVNAKSNHKEGDTVQLRNVVLGRYDGIVIHVPHSSAVGLSASIILLALGCLRIFFN